MNTVGIGSVKITIAVAGISEEDWAKVSSVQAKVKGELTAPVLLPATLDKPGKKFSFQFKSTAPGKFRVGGVFSFSNGEQLTSSAPYQFIVTDGF